VKIKTNFYKIFIYSMLFTGASLALVQFIFNRSLWQDEASLALNIVNLNFAELLKPFTNGQVAPILFLQTEKIFSRLWPASEYGLRLFPLACYCVTLFFFFKILRKTLPDYPSIVFTLSLFVFSPVMIRYSSEVKQYMSDTLVSAVFFYLLIKDYKSEQTRFIHLGLAGITGIFLSNIAPIVLLSSGMYLFYNYLKNKTNNLKIMLGVFAVWCFFFMVYYYYFIHDHPSKNMMVKFWTRNGSFFPLNPLEEGFWLFLSNRVRGIFSFAMPLGIAGKYLFFPLFITGIIGFVKQKKYGLMILTLAPVFIHLTLSALIIYPFALRLTLYLIPLFMLVTGFGFAFLLTIVAKKINLRKFDFAFLIIPLLFFSMFYLRGFPIEVNEFKKSIAFLKEHKKDNEGLFVDFAVANALKYYIQIDGIKFTKTDYGNHKRKFQDGYIDALIESKINLWILIANAKNRNHAAFFYELEKLGIACEKKYEATGTSVWLATLD